MQVIYTATSLAHKDEKDQSDHYWVSLDGERWHEVTRLPDGPQEYDQVAALFEPEKRADGHMFHRIAVGRAFIACWARQPVFHEPIMVPEAVAHG